MKLYHAKFSLPDGNPSFSEIWADSLEIAEAIAITRQMGPTTRKRGEATEFRPTKLAGLPGGYARPDVLHSICYLSFLAVRHGLMTAAETVQDDSPLHELAHYLGAGGAIRGGRMLEILEERLRWLERVIPGMPPDDMLLPFMPLGGEPR